VVRWGVRNKGCMVEGEGDGDGGERPLEVGLGFGWGTLAIVVLGVSGVLGALMEVGGRKWDVGMYKMWCEG